MKSTIWKITLEIKGIQELLFPKGATVICVQTQRGEPQLWVQVDPEEPQLENLIIETIGTGEIVEGCNRQYIGTYQLLTGNFVGHVFRKF